jgi:hypothetical protein
VALSLDGMAVLRAIGEHRTVFSGVSADAAKYARTLVMKQLKNKGSDLSTLRAVRAALSRDTFSNIIDAMTDAEVKSLVGRFDKYHPDFKTSNATWRRAHLRALADGKAAPSEEPPRATKTKAAPRKRAPKREFLDLQSMRVTRRRRS